MPVRLTNYLKSRVQSLLDNSSDGNLKTDLDGLINQLPCLEAFPIGDESFVSFFERLRPNFCSVGTKIILCAWWREPNTNDIVPFEIRFAAPSTIRDICKVLVNKRKSSLQHVREELGL